MRIVFMGTPEFAVPSLRALAGADGIEVVAAYSQPDSVSRRGKKPQPSAVRVAAEELGIEVRTPETLRDAAFLFSHPAGLAELPLSPVRRFVQRYYHWKGGHDHVRAERSA